MTARWLPIPGFEGKYDVSESGVVRSLMRKGRSRVEPLAIKDYSVGDGYRGVFLFKDGHYHSMYVHRAILLAHKGLPPTSKHEGAHRNGVRDDNRLDNLLWATHTENVGHKVEHGTHNRGERSATRKLTEAEVLECRRTYVPGSQEFGTHALAKRMGVSQGHMSGIVNYKCWAYDALEPAK